MRIQWAAFILRSKANIRNTVCLIRTLIFLQLRCWRARADRRWKAAQQLHAVLQAHWWMYPSNGNTSSPLTTKSICFFSLNLRTWRPWWPTARWPASLPSLYGWSSQRASAVPSSAKAGLRSRRSERWAARQDEVSVVKSGIAGTFSTFKEDIKPDMSWLTWCSDLMKSFTDRLCHHFYL